MDWNTDCNLGAFATYSIGDKVVYPMHGAGVIEAIEEHSVLGQVHQYYVMRMPIGDLKVMIPLRSVTHVGLREIICAAEVERVLEFLQSEQSDVSTNWNRRYRANLEKMKSGDIFEVAEVVRSLACRNQDKGLSTCERKMYDSARQILVSEIVLARGETEVTINRLLDEALSRLG